MQVHVAGLSEVHPTYTAIHFMNALPQLPRSLDYLASKVTPESRPTWGDFNEASGFFDALSEPGIVSIVRAFPNALDVAWVLIVEDVGSGGWQDGLPADDLAVAYFTMVNRPPLGGWLVHHLGDKIDISQVPRELANVPDGTRHATHGIFKWLKSRLLANRNKG